MIRGGLVGNFFHLAELGQGVGLAAEFFGGFADAAKAGLKKGPILIALAFVAVECGWYIH